MATSNFHKVNASQYYSVFFEADEENEGFQDFWYDDQIENIRSFLNEKGFNVDANSLKNVKDPHESRSFPSNVIASISEHKRICNVEFQINMCAVVRSGYYDGFNLDWFYEVEIEGDCDIDCIPDLEQLSETLSYYGDVSVGMGKIQAKNALKWLNETVDSLIENTEDYFKEITTPLVITARFSNGETFYAKA